MKLLVQAGADVNIKDSDNYTALDYAIWKVEKECGEFLRSVGAKCNKREYPSHWASNSCLIF